MNLKESVKGVLRNFESVLSQGSGSGVEMFEEKFVSELTRLNGKDLADRVKALCRLAGESATAETIAQLKEQFPQFKADVLAFLDGISDEAKLCPHCGGLVE